MSALLEKFEEVKAIVDRLSTPDAERELIVVSKNQGLEKIAQLYEVGHRRFGESYFEEWALKEKELPDDIEWHFIGPLQSRKMKKHRSLVQASTLVQSIDRHSTAKILSSCGSEEGTMECLVQVNLWGESQKGGKPRSELRAFLDELGELPHLVCRGLMAIPPFTSSKSETGGHFAELSALYQDLENEYGFSILSMGMSADFELALSHGATMVRVGSAIFGPRE